MSEEIFGIGRVCVKIAGRDAGKKAVILEMFENGMVLVDGEVRRRRINLKHLYPLKEVVKIAKNASHDDVIKVLDVKIRKGVKKTPSARPKRVRKRKIHPEVEKAKIKPAKRPEKSDSATKKPEVQVKTEKKASVQPKSAETKHGPKTK